MASCNHSPSDQESKNRAQDMMEMRAVPAPSKVELNVARLELPGHVRHELQSPDVVVLCESKREFPSLKIDTRLEETKKFEGNWI
jgi:hypothetical protein